MTEGLKVTRTSLDGVLLVEPPTIFEDFRGEYVELYNEEIYKKAGIHHDFIQDDISVSSRHVLRGIHGDSETAKLVSCLHGKFYLVVVNWDSDSPQYRQWEAFTLSEKNRLQVLIPPKFGNGHVVLSETAMFHYKQTSTYNRAGQFTVMWDDPDLEIFWPIKNPILSRRDAGLE
ncbi:MAG: dTDP-4-dehydrorhamnose 3,5-epimerase family protein [Rhodospirillales bacterium]|nr:dTDP-4-dehydrorhamnose 3,5-epimerase family protein [Rhodospirillales bacterium]MCW8952818.1 dTDP-4-dehydrorhamnose 3,5-epimerase family protein [Rhodospirillales bacterium]MCW9003091.1 dTDP-4-dehydrorhamnose 3,5-epimerase family protein [Rhodospirillales bacterium]